MLQASPSSNTIPLVIERTFDVCPELLFDAWLNPETLGLWLFRTLEGKLLTVEVDPRVGGAFRVAEQRGGAVADRIGHYVEIDRPRRLAFWLCLVSEAAATLVTLDFDAIPGRSRLRLTHYIDAQWAGGLEHTREAWTRILAGLAATVISERDFFISRVFDAPRELVFKAWTDPLCVAQWGGRRGFTNSACEIDLQPGGHYRLVMRSPDGVDCPLKGRFKEILQPERLVMSLDCSEYPKAWHDTVFPHRDDDPNPAGVMMQTVRCEKLDEKTRLSVRVRFASTLICAAMQHAGLHQGWSASLDRLGVLLARLQSTC